MEAFAILFNVIVTSKCWSRQICLLRSSEFQRKDLYIYFKTKQKRGAKKRKKAQVDVKKRKCIIKQTTAIKKKKNFY